MKKLKDKGIYFGRLSVNNVHLSSVLEVTCTDYGLMNALKPQDSLSNEEGTRLDIFCLGVMILKMMGKL